MSQYKERKSKGLCPRCGARPPEVGKTKCLRCLNYDKSAHVGNRADKRDKGLCVCGQCLSGKKWCDDCSRKRRISNRTAYRHRLDKGLCGICGGQPVLTDRSYCVDCKKKLRRRCRLKRLRLKIAAFSAYGGPKCQCCGTDFFEFLTIDHVGGEGAAHRREQGIKCGSQMYRWLAANGYPAGFQVLCGSCNLAKASGVECPCRGNRDPLVLLVLEEHAKRA